MGQLSIHVFTWEWVIQGKVVQAIAWLVTKQPCCQHQWDQWVRTSRRCLVWLILAAPANTQHQHVCQGDGYDPNTQIFGPTHLNLEWVTDSWVSHWVKPGYNRICIIYTHKNEADQLNMPSPHVPRMSFSLREWSENESPSGWFTTTHSCVGDMKEHLTFTPWLTSCHLRIREALLSSASCTVIHMTKKYMWAAWVAYLFLCFSFRHEATTITYILSEQNHYKPFVSLIIQQKQSCRLETSSR